MRLLLAQLATLAPKLVDAGLERHGLSSKDRVGPRALHASRLLLDRLARAFGVTEVDLYLASGESEVDVVLSEPVGIVIPDNFDNLGEAEQVLCLTRSLASIAWTSGVQAALGSAETELFLAAAATAVGFDVAGSSCDADEVLDTGQRLSKALPWLSKGRFEEAVRRHVAEPTTDVAAVLGALNRATLRLAVVLTDDLSWLAFLRERGSSMLGLEPAEIEHTIHDLLLFWVSPGAMLIRRQAGLL
jgi:hypothetical protein